MTSSHTPPGSHPTHGGDTFPSSRSQHGSVNENQSGLIARILRAVAPVRRKEEETLREVIEDAISHADDQAPTDIAPQERDLLANILHLRRLTASDVMIPRADIAALDIDTPPEAVLQSIAEKRFSLYPVYRETLDDIVGTIHIKDVLAMLAAQAPLSLKSLVCEALIVSPALPVADLLAQMRRTGKYMAMVVDEYGGIDGLTTLGDVTRAIVGEMGDERDPQAPPEIVEKADGSVVVDARLSIEDFEKRYGNIFKDSEESCDTLGGLVSALAGRVPARGEIVAHPSGVTFEVLDADLRRVRKLRMRHLPDFSLAAGKNNSP